MIVIPWSLAVLLALEAPAGAASCELTDNRCKAELYIRRAKEAPTAQQRALYLHAAHRSYLFLFDKTGDGRDLCAARRMFDQSLAVKGQPATQRANFEATRKDLESREHGAGGRCPGAAKRPSKPAPLVAAATESPAAQTAPASASDADAPAEPSGSRSSEPSAAVRPQAAGVQPLEPAAAPNDEGVDALLPVTRPSPAPGPISPPAAPRPGRNLAIAGGIGLTVGLGLTGVAGYLGGRLAETVRDAQALEAMVDGYATPDQLARDAALQQDYRRWGPPTLALALTGGTTLVVSAVLLGVGGHRLRKTASHTALVPVPGGLAFHARF